MKAKNEKSKGEWRVVGRIGVDAGLCWVGDPCYILHKGQDVFSPTPKAIGKDWNDFCDLVPLPQKFKQFDYDAGHPGLGVVVQTGYGDGYYPVKARFVRDAYNTERVAEIRVVFIDDEDEEFEEGSA